MLEFKPFDIDDNIYGYRAEENGENIGECIFLLSEIYAEILSVKTRNADRLIEEGLIRSALNFAANRSAYMARADVGRVEAEPFLTLGFEEKNGFYASDIPSALTGSCGHCAK